MRARLDKETRMAAMWRCPKCKAGIRIFDARTTVIIHTTDGAEPGDLEWGDGNQAECLACDWMGIAGEAYVEDAA